MRILTTVFLTGFCFPVYAQCYDSSQVDGHHDAYVAGHSSLTEDRGTYQQTDVDTLVTDLTTGVANSSTVCPPPQEPVGPLTDADLGADEIAENATGPIGITLTAIDPNPEDTLTYSLTDDLGKLAVDPVTGVVTAVSLFNFEVTPSFQVTGRVTSSDGSFSDAVFTVTVLDIEPENQLVLPPFVRVFDDTPSFGDGFNTNPPTASFNGTVFTGEGLGSTRDYMIFPHRPEYAVPNGTYEVMLYTVKWKEQSIANKRVPESPGWFDVQFGGSSSNKGAKLHPLINGSNEDQTSGSFEATYCQWVHFVMRWGDGQPVEFWINGTEQGSRTYSHSYTGGMENNIGEFTLGANRRPGGRSHEFGGSQFEPIVYSDRLTNEQIENLYTARFSHFPSTHHQRDTSGQSNPFGSVIKSQSDLYTCDNDPLAILPKSITEIGLTPVTQTEPEVKPEQGGLPQLDIEGTAAFAQAFAPGDLPANMGLKVGDTIIQVDPKALHPDGSVRHALLAGAASGRMQLAAKASCSPFDAARELIESEWSFRAEINGRAIRLKDLLKADLDAGRLDIWRSCPVVSEYRVSERIDEHTEAIFDIQVFSDTVSVTMTVDRGFVDAPDAKVSYRVVDGDELDRGSYTHWGQTRWWRTYGPEGFVEHDPVYLTRTGAVPRYDTSIDVKIPDVDSRLPVEPMRSPLNKLNMPQSGQTSKAHIGPMPTDFVKYVLKPDADLLANIEGYALGAASIGWFWRDLRQTGGRNRSVSRTGKWQVDEAHQPAFFYLPYLMTGKRVYLEGLQHQANSSLFDRDGNILSGQVRATAWKLRNLANAAYITPDSDPLKDYFVGHLSRTMTQWKAEYIGSGDFVGEVRGFHWRVRTNDRSRGKISPWQEDYLTIVLAWMVDMDVPMAFEILAWKSNYTLGRFEDHPGWDPYRGVSYYHRVATGAKPDVARWQDVTGYSNDGLNNGRPHKAGHYFDLAWGALKSVCNVIETDRCAGPLAFMAKWARGKKGVFERWRSQPKWAIRDGHAPTG